ncbi:Gfo/Idh/MocA family protein [Propionibacteriaceae bacterium Y2011]
MNTDIVTVALVGVNTYHATVFSQLINGTPTEPGRVTGARITHAWPGDHRDTAEELAAKHDFEVADELTSLVGAVDLVLVIDDTDGGVRHLELARPFLSAGMAVFVDKPVVATPDEVTELITLAAEHDALLMGGSALRYASELSEFGEQLATIGDPISYVSVCPNEWFYYGIHAVELLLALEPGRPTSVDLARFDNHDTARITFDGGRTGTVTTIPGAHHFHATVYGTKGAATITVSDAKGFYGNELQAMVEMARTKQAPSLTPTLDAVDIMFAGLASAESGRPVEVTPRET